MDMNIGFKRFATFIRIPVVWFIGLARLQNHTTALVVSGFLSLVHTAPQRCLTVTVHLLFTTYLCTLRIVFGRAIVDTEEKGRGEEGKTEY